MKIRPPYWADRFLEWYCHPDLLEEIQGDAYELFYRNATKSRWRAKLSFIWSVLRFFRYKNIKKSNKKTNMNNVTMLKSYLQMGFRNAIRNGGTSFINVFGLAVGVAGAITIFIYADQFFHTDDFQQKSDRVYEVTNTITRDKKPVTLSDVPIVLGPAIKEEIPAIENVVRIELGSGALRFGDKVFTETIYFTDNSFFDVFNFPMTAGDESALDSKKNIVLTKPLAEKYFEKQNALGKTISIKFPNNTIEEFTVSGIVDQPANNTMYFKVLLNIEVFFDLKLKDQYSWDYLTDGTFILLKPGHSIEEVKGMMNKYVKSQNESSPEWLTDSFNFYGFEELRSRSYEIESALVGSGHPQGVIVMGIIAAMLLSLACFNYMNISVATVSTRLKEIGIRKVLGGGRKQIIHQFVSENVMLCGVSVITGIGIAYFFFMPWLNILLAYKIPFAFSSGQSVVIFFSILILFIVLISGVYPALYISKFQPITILKGKEKFGERSRLNKFLLTIQFILAFTTIVGCFVFIDNSLYLKSKDWGYDHDQNIVVPVNTYEQYLGLRDEMKADKNILSLAGSFNHVGYWNTRSSVLRNEERFEVVSYRVGFDYMETMNIRLTEGRFFDKRIQSDQVESVIVSENFVKAMGWDSGINQLFEYDGVKRNVIGVVKNFHYDDFYKGILPVIFSIAPEKDFRYLSLKVQRGAVNETEATIKEAWKKIAPDDPYEGILQDDVFANWAQNSKIEMKLLGFVAVLTVMLSCLGLFGLVSYNITRRLREFSIRKVFGATIPHIFRLMNNDYIWILLVAFAIGAPAGLFLMDTVIHDIYVDPQSAGPIPFLIAISLMTLTVAVTVILQMRRVIHENPVETLRMD